MTAPLDTLTDEERGALRKRKQPGWTAPMLATLTDDYFSDPDWMYERKLDGERCLAFRKGKTVRLLSRNKKELNDTYPGIADCLAGQKARDFIADGEVVAFEGNRTSFARLQQRMQIRRRKEARASGVSVYYYVFDLIYLDGHDLSRLALRSRKRLLRRALSFEDPVRFLPHRNERGEDYHREACAKGWEGVIAKDARSPYRHKRSRKWLKFKCVNAQEFVIGGYTDPKGERSGFGALLIGYYRRGDLVYAGKVGTGYDEETLERLGSRLASLERETPAFNGDDLPSRGVHWTRPALVAQVGFTEWTEEGRLRHPRFLGLRRDKDPEQVRRETPS